MQAQAASLRAESEPAAVESAEQYDRTLDPFVTVGEAEDVGE